MRIGFACMWDARPEGTWSRTPWELREAMRRQADVADVGIDMSNLTRNALRALYPRWHDGRLRSVWDESSLADLYCRRTITRNALQASCGAVLEIQDLAPLDLPYFLYQDMSYDALVTMVQAGQPIFRKTSRDTLLRRQERQRSIYAGAAGILTMSHWLASSLVEVSGIPKEKVHVVHPGLHHADGLPWATEPPHRSGPRRRLLFVGRNFLAKGADLVLAALAILRRDVDPQITLTMVGVPEWPLPGPIPDGVDFRGVLPLSEVAGLYDSHDCFVLPTRIEGFGFVFLEALARGLPCVGRDAFAMPEIIRPGVNGALVKRDDAAELAGLVAGVLADDALYEMCRQSTADVRARFSWDRAATDAIEAITTTLER